MTMFQVLHEHKGTSTEFKDLICNVWVYNSSGFVFRRDSGTKVIGEFKDFL